MLSCASGPLSSLLSSQDTWHTCQRLFKAPPMRSSQQRCRVSFTLSQYLQQYVPDMTSVPGENRGKEEGDSVGSEMGINDLSYRQL